MDSNQERSIDFNPRSPHGERRSVGSEVGWLVDISIHAPRTGSDGDELDMERCDTISIHAPRTGSDVWKRMQWRSVSISIHAPRTGSDAGQPRQNGETKVFQSTLPARGATSFPSINSAVEIYFNPRSPHGERRFYAEGLKSC